VKNELSSDELYRFKVILLHAALLKVSLKSYHEGLIGSKI